MGKFKVLYDDEDSLWMRQIDVHRFHFIELTDMEYACGKDNEGHPKYVVELSHVDLAEIPNEIIVKAMNSSGCDQIPDKPEVMAEALHRYGTHAKLFDISTNSRKKGFRECRKESYRLTKNPEMLEHALRQPVNRIGSTAREFMQGDLNSAVVRGVKRAEPAAKLMARIGGYTVESIEAVAAQGSRPSGMISRIRLRHRYMKALTDDPLAYAYGFQTGLSGSGLGNEERKDLAKGYLDGYKHGVSVRIGDQPMPDWIK